MNVLKLGAGKLFEPFMHELESNIFLKLKCIAFIEDKIRIINNYLKLQKVFVKIRDI